MVHIFVLIAGVIFVGIAYGIYFDLFGEFTGKFNEKKDSSGTLGSGGGGA